MTRKRANVNVVTINCRRKLFMHGLVVNGRLANENKLFGGGKFVFDEGYCP